MIVMLMMILTIHFRDVWLSEMSGIKVFRRHEINHHDEHSLWYATAQKIGREANCNSCYVCSLMPHVTPISLILRPTPVSVEENLSVLCAVTLTPGYTPTFANVTGCVKYFPWMTDMSNHDVQAANIIFQCDKQDHLKKSHVSKAGGPADRGSFVC